MQKKYFILFWLILAAIIGNSQEGTIIGDKLPETIENSAELEIYSSNKGFLVPSIANPELVFDAMNPPATGLMVFNSTTNKFNYFNGVGWMELPYFSTIMDSDNDTKVSVELNQTDNDSIIFINNGTNSASLTYSGFNLDNIDGVFSINNKKALGTKNTNTLVGNNTGNAILDAEENTIFGSQNFSNSNSSNNTIVGALSGTNSGLGMANTIIGVSSGENATTDSSVFIGNSVGITASGKNHIFIGGNAGADFETGNGNIFIGDGAGYVFGDPRNTVQGSDNIILGNGVLLGDNKDGEIQIGRLIHVNNLNQVTFNESYTFPGTTGLQGQTLILDNDNSTLQWQNSNITNSDQTVVASVAGLTTFNIGQKDDDATLDYQRNIFVVSITPEMNTTINYAMTWIKRAYNSILEVAVYNGVTGDSIATGIVTYSIDGPDFVSVRLNNEVQLTKGIEYKVAVRVDNVFSDHAYSPNALGTIEYISRIDNGNANCDLFDNVTTSCNSLTLTSFPNINQTHPNFPSTQYRICTATNADIPWVRLY